MENTYNFDVNVILSDRLNPFPGNFDSEFLENNEEYKNLDKEYADDNNNLYDIYKDSSLSLYNNEYEGITTGLIPGCLIK